MLDKLNIVQQRFNEISDLIIQPNIISDQKRYIKLNKEYKDLGLLVEKKKIYEELLLNIKEAEEICKKEDDKEMIEMASDQLNEAKESAIDVAKRIVKDKQHEQGVDAQTANLIMKIYHAYDKHPALQKKFEKLPLKKLAQGVWRFVK